MATRPCQRPSHPKRGASILLTNPDMLHMGILPNHHAVVIAFSATCAMWSSTRRTPTAASLAHRWMRPSPPAPDLCAIRQSAAVHRLLRHHRQPARTHGNADRRAASRVVDEDGAPHGERTFVLWNPPLVEPDNGMRRSANTEAASLFAAVTRGGVRNLTFARTRRVAELILRYCAEGLARGLRQSSCRASLPIVRAIPRRSVGLWRRRCSAGS